MNSVPVRYLALTLSPGERVRVREIQLENVKSNQVSRLLRQ
jgi:hypothetical protein